MDITDPCYLEKMETTRLTLNELGCEKIKKITFFNKYDLGNIQLKRLLTKDELFTVCMGDESNEKEIIDFIVNKLTTKWKKHTFFIPYGENYYEFYKSAYVIKVIEKENGLEFKACINPKSFDKFSIYLKIKDS